MKEKFRNEWQPTGLLGPDLVASAVSHYRGRLVPLKTIYLAPKKYVQFTDWVRYNLEREGRVEEAEANIEQFTFDGVEVRMNSELMGEQTYFDFYPTVRAEA